MDHIDGLIEMSVPKSAGWRYKNKPTCRVSRVEAAKAWKTAIKINKEDPDPKVRKETEDQLYIKCILALEAQERFRRDERAAGEKPPQPVMLTVWLNNGRWGLDIGSHAELKQRVASQKCKCGRDVMGPSFDKCDDCYPFEDGKMTGNMAEEMRDYYRKHPEIAKFTREQALTFIRNKARGIGK